MNVKSIPAHITQSERRKIIQRAETECDQPNIHYAASRDLIVYARGLFAWCQLSAGVTWLRSPNLNAHALLVTFSSYEPSLQPPRVISERDMNMLIARIKCAKPERNNQAIHAAVTPINKSFLRPPNGSSSHLGDLCLCVCGEAALQRDYLPTLFAPWFWSLTLGVKLWQDFFEH